MMILSTQPAGIKGFERVNNFRTVRFAATSQDAYNGQFQQRLFDEMGNVYERVGDICSLGFNRLWRRNAIKLLDLKSGDKVCDLMAGTGESWKYVLPKIGAKGQLISLDFSNQMSVLAQSRKSKSNNQNVQVIRGDALAVPLMSGSVDAVFSAYGVKTLPSESLPKFVSEIKRILKPGGRFSLVEVSLPENRLHQMVFHCYLNIGFPLLKRVLGKRADHFSMFNQYLTQFKNCKALQEEFKHQGFLVSYKRLLGDGATTVYGYKPTDSSTN